MLLPLRVPRRCPRPARCLPPAVSRCEQRGGADPGPCRSRGREGEARGLLVALETLPLRHLSPYPPPGTAVCVKPARHAPPPRPRVPPPWEQCLPLTSKLGATLGLLAPQRQFHLLALVLGNETSRGSRGLGGACGRLPGPTHRESGQAGAPDTGPGKPGCSPQKEAGGPQTGAGGQALRPPRDLVPRPSFRVLAWQVPGGCRESGEEAMEGEDRAGRTTSTATTVAGVSLYLQIIAPPSVANCGVLSKIRENRAENYYQYQ